MFERILIANRGEIACRVIRTCRRLGIETVAVYSDADREAQHVLLADRAVHIGGERPADSYLRANRILAAARAEGAQAIHPGYGFLSENAAFARAVTEAGIAFVGPSAETIDLMGSKSEAKRTMESAGVPTVPGYHGADQDETTLAAEAERVGFPLMIKAVAGGGGKGMRIVHEAGAFTEALGSARREAANAFGDDSVLLERYVLEPRHIEVQVFGDAHGNALHLFERDCSSQRRYQKIIEEAPAASLALEQREALCAAAVRAAQAVDYRNAGTVEFIVDRDGGFYFMEMNTRLQVEHPVTEAITGVDLVEWQLRVAAGEHLPLAQDEIRQAGHALEARLYAEDPAQGFLPSTGRLEWLRFPDTARADTGVTEGDTVTVHYDPMIAKLIVHGPDRAAALAALESALARTVLRGLTSNRDFLLALCRHPIFVSGSIDTGYLDRQLDAVLDTGAEPPDDAILAAALVRLLAEEDDTWQAQGGTADPWSPWGVADGWRTAHRGRRVISLRWQDRHFVVDAWGHEGAYRIALPGEDREETEVEATRFRGDTLHWRTPTGTWQATVFARGPALHVVVDGRPWEFTAENAFGPEDRDGPSDDRIAAPMPGRVVSLSIAPGDTVTEGQTVAVMEAMKMELTLAAPRDGVIGEIRASEGEFVEADTVLVVLADPES